MKTWLFRVFLIVGSSMLVAFVVSDGRAQCGAGARNFATIGGSGLVYMRVEPGFFAPAAYNQDQEFGRFWECDTGNGNNFIPGDPARRMTPAGTGGCASHDNAQAGGG